MDPADRAAQIEERQLAAAAAAATHPGTVVKRPPDAPASCEDCGIAIPPERLVAMPAATRCVRCQEYHERMERRKA